MGCCSRSPITGDDPREVEIRQLADRIYRRVSGRGCSSGRH